MIDALPFEQRLDNLGLSRRLVAATFKVITNAWDVAGMSSALVCFIEPI
jgi:hypothetical protein